MTRMYRKIDILIYELRIRLSTANNGPEWDEIQDLLKGLFDEKAKVVAREAINRRHLLSLILADHTSYKDMSIMDNDTIDKKYKKSQSTFIKEFGISHDSLRNYFKHLSDNEDTKLKLELKILKGDESQISVIRHKLIKSFVDEKKMIDNFGYPCDEDNYVNTKASDYIDILDYIKNNYHNGDADYTMYERNLYSDNEYLIEEAEKYLMRGLKKESKVVEFKRKK